MTFNKIHGLSPPRLYLRVTAAILSQCCALCEVGTGGNSLGDTGVLGQTLDGGFGPCLPPTLPDLGASKDPVPLSL